MNIKETIDKYFRPWEKDKPCALPIDFGKETPEYTWNDWEDETKSKWPIRFYLFHDLPFEISCKWKWWIIDPIWKFKYRFISKHKYHIVRTGLKPGYYDPDTLMLYSWMKLLTDFVDETKDTIEWSVEGHREVWDDFQKVYKWWGDYDSRLKKIDDAYHDIDDIVTITRNGEEIEVHRANVMEEQLDRETTEMLYILAKHRKQIWYP